MTRRVGPTDSDYLMCRTLGHAWDQVPAEHLANWGGVPWALRCVRCTTVREDEIAPGTGELLHRRYRYADEYRHAFDSSFDDLVPSRSDFRRLLFTEHLYKARQLRAIKGGQSA